MDGKDDARGSFNAFLLECLESYMDRVYGGRKRVIFAQLPLQIVEIGPGTGANFLYYRRGTKVTAVEPNPSMHPHLSAKAHRCGIELDIHTVPGEELDLAAESTEAVVGTLVLCSVENPSRVVAEVRRILKPGGRYVFLEHVAAPKGSHLRSLQDLLHEAWHWLFDGCNLNRDTHSILLDSGFSAVDMDCFMLRPAWVPVTPHIFGLAVK